MLPRSVKMVNAELLRSKIMGPYVLGGAYPELSKHALVCVTETTSRGEIERDLRGRCGEVFGGAGVGGDCDEFIFWGLWSGYSRVEARWSAEVDVGVEAPTP